MGGCGLAWFGLVVIFFCSALLNKWAGDDVGLEFNMIISIVLGFFIYILMITFTGSVKFALIAGILGLLAGGYLTPYVWNADGGGDEY